MEPVNEVESGHLYAKNDRDFKAIYYKTLPTLLRVVAGILYDREAAEDVAHTAFAKMYEKQKTFTSMDHALYWLLRVAMNDAKSILRHQKALTVLSVDGLDAVEEQFQSAAFVDASAAVMTRSAEAAFFQGRDSETLRKAVINLPKGYREVIVLREIAGFSYDKISSILKTSEKNVRVRTHRARKALLRYLTSQGGLLP